MYLLAGKLTCSVSNTARPITSVGTRDGDGIDVVRTVLPASGTPTTEHDRFAYDPASRTWRADLDVGSAGAMHFQSGNWPANAGEWLALAKNPDGTTEVLRLEAQGGLLFRTLEHRAPGVVATVRESETCAPGNTAPDILHCANPNVPAHTLVAVPPNVQGIPRGLSGRVLLIVSIDEASQVQSVKVQSSPSAMLNEAAIASARASTYQTTIRNCRSFPGDFVFSVDFRS